jgi:transposase InsO family protein
MTDPAPKVRTTFAEYLALDLKAETKHESHVRIRRASGLHDANANVRAERRARLAQQLRNATPNGRGPRFLLRDRDSKFGVLFGRVAAGAGIRVLRTPFRAPRANSICERFLGSVRRECVDHILLLGDRHLERVLAEYARYFNADRPHQGIVQQIPVDRGRPANTNGRVVVTPVLGGLHNAYRRAS